MKKSIKKTIISLALCASASCVVGGVSFLRSGQQVVAADEVTTSAYYTLDGFTIDDSASVRNTSPNGIRFKTILSEETRTAIGGLNLSDVSYGTLMLPADLLGSNELTHESKSVLDVETALWQDEDKTTWTSVLAGAAGSDLSENYYNRPIAARSYVTGTDSSGNTVYYYTENTAFRSIGYVAMMEYLAPNGNVTELIETIAAKTDVELVFNSTGMVSVAQNSTEGTALISNTLSTSSDSVVAYRIGGMVVTNGPSFLPEITYEVENTDVIGVSGSTLTANAEGETVVTASCTFNGKPLTVSKNVSTTGYKGVSDYKILIRETAKTAPDILNDDFSAGGQSSSASFERAAAEKMQSVWFEATGVELPIVTSVGAGDKYISIGETALATANTVLSSEVQAKDTASEVFVVDGNVYIRGSVANESILYGVQLFLKDTVGYDFFMENTYTTDTNVEVVVKATKYVPDMEFNMSQSDIRSDGVADEYMMQSYTRNIIALGITDEEETGGKHYKGVAHNTVYVVNNGTYQSSSSPRYSSGSSPWKTWYATYQGGFLNGTTYYRTIDDPHTEATDYIMAELCYTAHGASDSTNTNREALIKVVVDEMITELAQYRDLYRLGFGHMDHRYWCECSNCTADGNPSDNLLEFLLDVAAAVEARWSETGRPDSDKDLFKISSLFYHKTLVAPKSTTNYADKLSTYGKHVEVWFAESAGDYVVPITDTSSSWNVQILKNLEAFSSIANTYGMDILWWTYDGMVAQFFVPYNSIYALRGTYAKAVELGIDYKFNQLMMSKVNFTRLKDYLISKLAWDADVDEATYNTWITDYFDGAYGAGSEKMQAYFTEWTNWATTNQSTFINSVSWDDIQDGTTSTNDASTWNDEVLMSDRKTYFPETTLQKWLDLIDQAIAALDPNDPNYETYYWNMKLEKLTPLYLMLYVYGGNNTSYTTDTAGVLLSTGTFDDESYLLAYGQEFLDITNHWKFNYYGESRYLTDFNGAIQTALNNASASSTTVASRQIVNAGSSFTLTNEALVDGTYTVSVVNANDISDKPTATVSVSGGVATVTATIKAGNTYIVEMKSSGKIVKFTNVLAISGYITTVDQLKAISGDGYYMLANDINCANATFASTNTFTGVLDGANKTISNFTVGAGGIFGTLSNATVKDVTFMDITATGETVSAENVFGTISSATFEDVNVYVDNAALVWPAGINVNYVKAEKRAYVVSGEKDTTLYNAIFVKGNTYTVTLDGVDMTVTAYSNGKLNLTVGAMPVGSKKTLLCYDNATNSTYVFDLIGATALIKTPADLAALGIGGYDVNSKLISGALDSKVAGNDISGYYAMVADMDCAGALFTPGHNFGSSYFIGTFDGNGYTISNLIVGDSGIFGGLNNATIKDVNFTGVEIELSATAGWNYGALLATIARNTTFENISAQFSRITDIADHDSSLFHTGLLVANGLHGNIVFRNITLNVAKATTRVENTIPCIFGSSVSSAFVCEDVTLLMKVSQQNAGIIYYYTDGSKGSPVTTKPTGLTIVSAFGITNTETVIAAGESLTITTNNESGTVTFSLASAVTGVDINSVTGELTVADSVQPNTAFTVVADNGTYADTRTFKVAKWQETLDESVVIVKTDGTFTVPTAISGTIEYAKLDGLTIYNNATGVGSISGNVITCDSGLLASIANGANKTLIIANEMYEYTLTADVCDEIIYIETAEQLRNLGVGGMVNANGENITGYYMLKNDITIVHDDTNYTDVFAAGYPQVSGAAVNNRFKAIFNGNGYTIDGVRVSDGGIFGAMDSATVKNVNFTNVEYLRDGVPSTITNQQGGYMALLAYSAPNTTFENINITVASIPSAWSWKRMGTLVVSGSAGATTFRDITLDASGLTIDNILGISVNANNVYENIKVIAEGYVAIGYTGDSYNSGVQNTTALITVFPTGIKFMRPFTITNSTTEISIGSSFDVTVSNNELDITYALKAAVDGVSIENNTVTVDANAEIGATFTVVATSSEGYVTERTFTVAKAQTTLSGTVTIEAITDTLDLSGIDGISGTIASIKIVSSDANVEDLTVYSGSTAVGEIAMASRPVKAAHLGEDKTIIIETESARYLLNANVYTMIIDDAAELDTWQSVAADNSVAAGLVIEEQKNAVLSGYFALGGDIEYNKKWSPILEYSGRWNILDKTGGIGSTVVDKEGAIFEDWGKGLDAGFMGTFDGNGYAIKGLKTSGDYSAFIVTGAGGTLKDVAFTGAEIGANASLLAARGSMAYQNVYVKVVAMENGTKENVNEYTAVLTQYANQNAWVSKGFEAESCNIIVDFSAIDFASLTKAKVGSLVGAYYNNFYVVGVSSDTNLFMDANIGNGQDNKDVMGYFADIATLMKDATAGAAVATWSEPWSVSAEGELTFGSYMVYDALEEIAAQNTINVSLATQLAGTSVVFANDTTTIDLSEFYSSISGKTTTVKYGDTVIYEGVIDSASWAMPLTNIPVSSKGAATFTFTADKTKIVVPVNFVQESTIELNSTNVTNAVTLQTILQSNLSANYVLTSDLDLGGQNLKGIAVFNGTFDGQGYVIKNTALHHDAITNLEGDIVTNNWTNGVSVLHPAFIYTNNGTVENVGFELSYITFTTGGRQRGIVNTNNGTVENVYIKVTVKDEKIDGGSLDFTYLYTGIAVHTNKGTVNNVLVEITENSGLTIYDNTFAAVYTNSATVSNVHAVVLNAANVNGYVAVANGASATCYKYTDWSEVSASTITAMGTPWSADGNRLYFGDKLIADNTTSAEIDETIEISTADGTFTLPEAVEGTVTKVTIDGITVYSNDIGSIDGDVITVGVELTAGTGKVMVIYTDSATYTLSATVTTPLEPGYAPLDNVNQAEFTAYSGDTTSMGFKTGDNVYEITTANLWTDRIVIPADSDNYDYVEFDVYPTAKVAAFTAWPSNGSGTQGSFGIYGAMVNVDGSVARTVQVWTADGNTFKAQYTSGFEANTIYTIRVCFAAGETLKYLHFGTGTAQTYYISSARWGKFDVQNDVYDNTTGTLHAKYEGDVTALGFDEGSTVTQVTIANAWSSRVGINANVKYDYVDVEWSFTGDCAVGSLCVWAYGTDAKIFTGNYTVLPSGGVPASNASERKIQIFDTDYNAVSSYVKDTAYILRVYLNGDASTLAVSTFSTTVDVPAILNFGDITYGNEVQSDEYIIFEPTTGSYTLPTDLVNDTVKKIVVNGITIYDENTGSLTGNTGIYDATFDIGVDYEAVIFTEENNTYYLNAIATDYVVKTADELRALGVGGMVNTDITANITGYYVLSNDIEIVHQDDYTDVFAAGYPKSGTYYFSGTFNGLGHTVKGVRVADGGIFGMMRNATVKNLNLTHVQYREDAPSTVTNQSSGYRSLLAFAAPSSTFENINVHVVYTTGTWDYKRDGVLVCTSSWGAATYRNITVDAAGIKLRTLLGISHSDSNVYENVVFKSAGYLAIGYTADSYDSNTKGQNTAALMTEFPDGVTYEYSNGMVAQNAAYTMDYEVYTGDVTALGFAEGTRVLKSGIDTASGWDIAYASRAKLGAIESGYDYVDIQFSVANAGATFTVWDGVNASYTVTATSVTPSKTESARTIVILNADGDRVGSIAANTMYVMRVYTVAANGDGINNFQITSTNAGTIYFGNVTFANEEEITVNGLGLTMDSSYPLELQAVTFDEVNAYKVNNYLGADTARANLDVSALAGKSTLTFSFYIEEGTYADSDALIKIRVKPYSSSYVYIYAADYTLGQWNTVTLDLTELAASGTITQFSFQPSAAAKFYIKDITVS